MSSVGDVMQPVVVLHVFSGPHAGACIELQAGTWVLGADDSCDIILGGLEPRHAVLEVTAPPGVGVILSPLDGAVRPAGAEEIAPTADEATSPLVRPEAGSGWALGRTCLAWNLPGVMQPVPEPDAVLWCAVDGRQPVQPSVELAEQAVPADNNPAPTPDTDPKNANEVGSANDPEPLQMQASIAARAFAGPAQAMLFGLLIVLLLALSLVLTPTVDPEGYSAVVKTYLAEAGISGLTVTARRPGVEVRGTVPDDAVMVQLYKMARALHFPVYLEVGVREDVLRAVRSSLGIRGFHPEVDILEDSGTPRLHVAAYMKDTALETGAFAALDAEVKGLPAVERRIVHEKELAPALDEALQTAGLADVRVIYLPGRVDFAGTVRPEDVPQLKRIREELSARFGAPLFGTSPDATPLLRAAVGSSSPLPEAKDGGSGADPQSGKGNDLLGGLRVTGVTMSPMRFVTTADGKRLFEGAVLPGGAVLEGIGTRALTLRRDGHVFTYTLRGSR